MTKPWLGISIGDLHVGSDTGLAMPGFLVGSKQKRPYQPSANQEWLYESWQNFYKLAQTRAKGRLVFLELGGDLIDGVLHHESTQTWGTANDQRSMAQSLLKPFVSMADDARGVLGTPAHVGDVGDDDAAIYSHFKIDYDDRWELEIGGRVILLAHDGIAVGRRDQLEENQAATLLRDIEIKRLRRGQRHADAIIGHDKHITFHPFMMRGTSIAVCPCWQLSTTYGAHWPYSEPTIGGLLWDVPSNVIERIPYAPTKAIGRIGNSTR